MVENLLINVCLSVLFRYICAILKSNLDRYLYWPLFVLANVMVYVKLILNAYQIILLLAAPLSCYGYNVTGLVERGFKGGVTGFPV